MTSDELLSIQYFPVTLPNGDTFYAYPSYDQTEDNVLGIEIYHDTEGTSIIDFWKEDPNWCDGIIDALTQTDIVKKVLANSGKVVIDFKTVLEGHTVSPDFVK